MPENALAGGEEDIGGNKPADFGVIVPALEVVEAGFLIIDTRMSSTRQKFLACA